jgi:hypothetical protein
MFELFTVSCFLKDVFLYHWFGRDKIKEYRDESEWLQSSL